VWIRGSGAVYDEDNSIEHHRLIVQINSTAQERTKHSTTYKSKDKTKQEKWKWEEIKENENENEKKKRKKVKKREWKREYAERT
jgi:hypothetical protein